MKVMLDEGLFAEPVIAQASLDLLTIFRLGFEQRHTVLLDFNRMAAPLFEGWLKHRPDYERDRIEGALRYGLQSDARDVLDTRVSVRPVPAPRWDCCWLPPDVAVSLLIQPLEILVEDSVNDQAFFRAIAVGPLADSFERFRKNEWLRFIHGGGLPSMERQITSRAENPKERLRTWAIFDSDELAPGFTSNDESQNLVDLCTVSAVAHHRLWRRAMENYLPPDFLLEHLRGEPKEPAARAFKSLRDPKQRHHYNMKAGFEGDGERLDRCDSEVKDAVSALFFDLSPTDRAMLMRGFGSKIGELFRFETGQRRPRGMTEAMIRQDGAAEEIEQILARIMSSI
jgi:hypothetical protein